MVAVGTTAVGLGRGVEVEAGARVEIGVERRAVDVGNGVHVRVGLMVGDKVAVRVGVGETTPAGVPVRVMTAVGETVGAGVEIGVEVLMPGDGDGLSVGVDKGETTVGVAAGGVGWIVREGLCMPQPATNTASAVSTKRTKLLNRSLQKRIDRQQYSTGVKFGKDWSCRG